MIYVVNITNDYASDIAEALPIEEYYGILVLGGDETLHEILNGIMRRSDWKEVCSLWTLGSSPLGLNYRIYETNCLEHGDRDPLRTCLMIAKGMYIIMMIHEEIYFQ